MGPLTPVESTNYNTLQRVFSDGADVVVRSRLTTTIPAGTEVAVVCALAYVDDMYDVTPFALLIPGDPYTMLEDPTADLDEEEALEAYH